MLCQQQLTIGFHRLDITSILSIFWIESRLEAHTDLCDFELYKFCMLLLIVVDCGGDGDGDDDGCDCTGRMDTAKMDACSGHERLERQQSRLAGGEGD